MNKKYIYKHKWGGRSPLLSQAKTQERGVFFFGHHDALPGKPAHKEKGREEEGEDRGWLDDGDGGIVLATVRPLKPRLNSASWRKERLVEAEIKGLN